MRIYCNVCNVMMCRDEKFDSIVCYCSFCGISVRIGN